MVVSMKTPTELPTVLFEDQAAWHDWLEQHAAQEEGLWLKIAKKASGRRSVSYAEALDEALCYGWIDGQKQAYNESYFLQKFTPRRAKSIWSKINVEKVGALTDAGRMKPTGLAAVAAAQKDGRWEQAYDSHRTIEAPPDFLAALDAHPRAKQFYATLNKTNVYAILWRIHTTKKPELRAAKIEKLIDMLDRGEKLH
jgi:uncharacterized protein YdeI (YjbR/CyaY-like superfamily)